MSVNELFKKEMKIVNIGLESFYRDFQEQGIPSIHVQWKPLAGGNRKMASLLGKLKSSK
ncbi:MAG TPA: fdrA domain protein [Clostridia bacterium]|nr:fdrA domain protein [Clostridia bacterium]